MDVQISRGFTSTERSEVGVLYWEAFGSKLIAAFPDEETGSGLVTAGLHPEHVLVARAGSEVAGVCGFNEDGVGAVDMTWALLRTRLSPIRSLWAAIVLSILARGDQPGVLVLDGICVRRECRGLGIGSRLLSAAAVVAGERGDAHVQLSVISTNPRAEALYLRSGFEITNDAALGPLRHLFGFDRYATLRRTLS